MAGKLSINFILGKSHIMEYYIRRNGKIIGPVADAKIRSMYAMQKLNPENEISVDQENWQKLSDFMQPASSVPMTPHPEVTPMPQFTPITPVPAKAPPSSQAAPPPSQAAPPPTQDFSPTDNSPMAPILKDRRQTQSNQVRPEDITSIGQIFDLLFTFSFMADCFKLLFAPMQAVDQLREKYGTTGAWAGSIFYSMIPIGCLAYFVYFELPKSVVQSGTVVLRLIVIILVLIACACASTFITGIFLGDSKKPFAYDILSSCGVITYIPLGFLACFLCWKHLGSKIMKQGELQYFMFAVLSFIFLFCVASGIIYLYGSLSKIYKIKEKMLVSAVALIITATFALFSFAVKIIAKEWGP